MSANRCKTMYYIYIDLNDCIFITTYSLLSNVKELWNVNKIYCILFYCFHFDSLATVEQGIYMVQQKSNKT